MSNVYPRYIQEDLQILQKFILSFTTTCHVCCYTLRNNWYLSRNLFSLLWTKSFFLQLQR